MQKYLIRNINVVNEGVLKVADVLVGERIEKIDSNITVDYAVKEINGEGKYLLPGVIDDQVHFREPGLTHKATIQSESRAAVAGGVTSFMEMPNTQPPTFTQDLLEQKYELAKQNSFANYSFYMGTSNDNLDEVLRTNYKKTEVCGIKIFMGSSTGNLLVDDQLTLENIFSESELLIATHCEDEKVIRQNFEILKNEKKNLTIDDHPFIRNEEACYQSSCHAIKLAKKYDTRLHILHISTEKELSLFNNSVAMPKKRITAEVCVHHLHFTSTDYMELGNLIKCNPAIKQPFHKQALWHALLDNRLDIIASDHAPHLLDEKGCLPPNPSGRGGEEKLSYEKIPSGIPLVQHSFLLMLHYYKCGRIPIEKVAEKMCHSVADCFQIDARGYIREGYFADLVIVDMDTNTRATKENIYYKCGWSPFQEWPTREEFSFPATITHTFVNGNLVYENGSFNESVRGKRLSFKRI